MFGTKARKLEERCLELEAEIERLNSEIDRLESDNREFKRIDEKLEEESENRRRTLSSSRQDYSRTDDTASIAGAVAYSTCIDNSYSSSSDSSSSSSSYSSSDSGSSSSCDSGGC